MKAWASLLLVVTGKCPLPIPGIKYARCRGPSLNASPCTECPGAGTAGLASEEDAVGLGGSWATTVEVDKQDVMPTATAPIQLKTTRIRSSPIANSNSSLRPVPAIDQ